MQTESEIKTAIIKTLKKAGALPVTIWQGPLSRKGISDLLVCHEGKFIALEIKRPGGKPTKEQLDFIRDVQRAGGIGFIADSAEVVINELNLEAILMPLFNLVGEYNQ